ncbi:MAG: protein kinase, partial [Planctomycetota bacterium]
MSPTPDQPGTAASGGSAAARPVSGETRPISGSGAPIASESPMPSIEDSEKALAEIAKGGTNLDTLVGRLVVEQGFATDQEVRHAVEIVKESSSGDAGQQSLAQVLVDHEFVTKRQIARLRQMIEAERSGQKIPGYRILGKLGAGAMATVFKGKQLSLDRTVAIKVLPQKFSQNPQFIERFYAEGRAAASLNHPNIVQAFDVGKANEYHYFVMEYVDGRTVYDDIVAHKRYAEAEAIN